MSMNIQHMPSWACLQAAMLHKCRSSDSCAILKQPTSSTFTDSGVAGSPSSGCDGLVGAGALCPAPMFVLLSRLQGQDGQLMPAFDSASGLSRLSHFAEFALLHFTICAPAVFAAVNAGRMGFNLLQRGAAQRLVQGGAWIDSRHCLLLYSAVTPIRQDPIELRPQ